MLPCTSSSVSTAATVGVASWALIDNSCYWKANRDAPDSSEYCWHLKQSEERPYGGLGGISLKSFVRT